MGVRIAAVVLFGAMLFVLQPMMTALADTVSSNTASADSTSVVRQSDSAALTAASAGDTFTRAIDVGGTEYSCVYKVLTVDGTAGAVQVGDGDSRAISQAASGALSIPTTVEQGGVTYAVTAQGKNCFAFCTGLTDTGLAANSTVMSLGNACFFNTAIGSRVTSIGASPFGWCDLESVCYYGDFAAPSDKSLAASSGISVYYLSGNETWAGKTVSNVASDAATLKPLSAISVQYGTVASAPSNHWSKVVGSASYGRWAEGESAALSATDTARFDYWMTSDASGSFAVATSATTTYTVGSSKGAGQTVLMAYGSYAHTVNFADYDGVVLSTQIVDDGGVGYGTVRSGTHRLFVHRMGYRFFECHVGSHRDRDPLRAADGRVLGYAVFG